LRLDQYFNDRIQTEPVKALIESAPYRLTLAPNSHETTTFQKESPISAGKTIGLICALRSNWFNSELIAGVAKAARKSGTGSRFLQ
jgi:hypothetical protein